MHTNEVVLDDPVLGRIRVQKADLGPYNKILFTTFFQKNGIECRNETTVRYRDLEELDDVLADEFIRNKIVADIEAGNYETIGEVVKPMKDDKFPNDPKDEVLQGDVLESSPDETQLAIVALLMRQNDLLLALLNHFDPDKADEIYAAHEQGATFQPKLFIPVFQEDDGTSDS